MKVLVLKTFHRFVAQPDDANGKPTKEKREEFAAGMTVEASDTDAESWIAKELAKAAE